MQYKISHSTIIKCTTLHMHSAYFVPLSHHHPFLCSFSSKPFFLITLIHFHIIIKIKPPVLKIEKESMSRYTDTAAAEQARSDLAVFRARIDALEEEKRTYDTYSNLANYLCLCVTVQLAIYLSTCLSAYLATCLPSCFSSCLLKM